MNTLQSCAVALVLAVPTGISAAAVAQTTQISVDREACINSNNAAPEPAIAALAPVSPKSWRGGPRWKRTCSGLSGLGRTSSDYGLLHCIEHRPSE